MGARLEVVLAVVVAASGLSASMQSAAAASTPGSVLWSRRYNGPGNAEDEPRAVAVSPDGSTTFVTGLSAGPSGIFDYFTVAYDTVTGSLVWTRRYSGPVGRDNIADAIAVSPDGSAVFVTGRSTTPGYKWRIATVAYDAATGARLWATRSRNGEAHAIGVSPDGSTVFAAGMTTAHASFVTIAYDAATGASKWAKTYALPRAVASEAKALTVSPDGAAVTVVGDSADSSYLFDYATIRYNAADGTIDWFRRFDGRASRTDVGEAIGSTPDGSMLVVSGRSQARRSPMKLVTLAYDSTTGATLWKRSRGGPSSLDTGAVSLAIAPDGSAAYVATPVGGPWTSDDYGTVAYDATTGATRWFREYDAAGYADIPLAIAVSSGGEVAVTGLMERVVTRGEFGTVVYDGVTGAGVWLRRYNPSGYKGSVATALTFTPDGSELIVTGESNGAASSYDYETLAYSTG